MASAARFFYIDDFFYWLGCKFVTCEKRKPEGQAQGGAEEKETEKFIPRTSK